MRFLFLSCIAMCLASGCRVKSNDTDIEAVTRNPIPIQDNTAVAPALPVTESFQPFERADSTPITSSLSSELSDDPAPAPPNEALEDSTGLDNTEDRSARDALDSITRVLQGAFVGRDKETGDPETKSIFGSVGRALVKGLQEAATSESQNEE